MRVNGVQSERVGRWTRGRGGRRENVDGETSRQSIPRFILTGLHARRFHSSGWSGLIQFDFTPLSPFVRCRQLLSHWRETAACTYPRIVASHSRTLIEITRTFLPPRFAFQSGGTGSSFLNVFPVEVRGKPLFVSCEESCQTTSRHFTKRKCEKAEWPSLESAADDSVDMISRR